MDNTSQTQQPGSDKSDGKMRLQQLRTVYLQDSEILEKQALEQNKEAIDFFDDLYGHYLFSNPKLASLANALREHHKRENSKIRESIRNIRASRKECGEEDRGSRVAIWDTRS